MTTTPRPAPGPLERRYRRMLLAYPRGYRAGHGEELIATLLATAEPHRSTPPLTEAVALLAGGLRTRAVQAARGPAWADAVHLAITALSVANVAMLLPYAGTIPVWTGLAVFTAVAVARRRFWLALPAAGLTCVKVAAIGLGLPWLDGTLLPVFADPLPREWGVPALLSMGGPAAPATAHAMVFLGAAVLAVRWAAPRARSWRWALAVPLLIGVNTDMRALTDPTATPGRTALEIGLLLLAGWAGHVAADPRWALAALLYLPVEVVELAENIGTATRGDYAHLALLVFLTGAAAAAVHRSRRHALL
ncbi:hypothetical protein C1I98_26455 [Spongiactinospora gelatinilytica]|uniref:Uncharacterized protein n=1 Tax=Spongiactinospora gelatinilytica TaxID=2666298 RepID=A0A2W2GRH1_9ACTN|nr:hypothetical protein [Spongiactinospora gelatinilytica]PZG36777.1 hypothetical protein C1I98_26455 [Spongiactinospora gelatinilytica]